jgi:hypothetical protein
MSSVNRLSLFRGLAGYRAQDVWIDGPGRLLGPNPALVHAGAPPELARDLDRVDTGRLPPRSLVSGAVNRAVMGAARRDGEFVAGLAAEGPRLNVPKMQLPRKDNHSVPNASIKNLVRNMTHKKP